MSVSSEGSSPSEADSVSEASSPASQNQFGGLMPTGYVYPAIHKLVASNDELSLETYVLETYQLGSHGPQPWDLTDAIGRNPLHVALLLALPKSLSVLLRFELNSLESRYGSGTEGQDDGYKRFSILTRKYDGMSFLHLAVACANQPHKVDDVVACIDVVSQHPSFEFCPKLDSVGHRTALHFASSSGSLRVMQKLASVSPSSLSTADDHGRLPLHVAIDAADSAACLWHLDALEQSDKESLVALLSKDLVAEPLGDVPDANDLPVSESKGTTWKDVPNPILYAIERSAWQCMRGLCQKLADIVLSGVSEEVQHSVYEKLSQHASSISLPTEIMRSVFESDGSGLCHESVRAGQTALVYDERCLGHIRLANEGMDGHQRLKRIKLVMENPTRLEVLVGHGGSLLSNEFSTVKVISSVDTCPISDVLRVHDWGYIKHIRDLIRSLPLSSMTPIDRGDTNVTQESWEAALRAAGCVTKAVDLVASGSVTNAFCAVRPPGHHVSTRGPVDSNLEDSESGSNGFCLLNNVGIGAAYAMCVHRQMFMRVAMIDFDIHHGNGTEGIVRSLQKPKSIRIPIGTFGLSGHLDYQTYRPWLHGEEDYENVFFASVHRYDGHFYPGSGDTSISENGNIVNIGMPSGCSNREFKKSFEHIVFPKLLAFAPDIIFVSAGFDGHKNDRLAMGEWDIDETDYYWITERLMAIANMCCKGRLVSVLEGGYNTRTGWLSPLAQSVASHFRALSRSTVQSWTEPPVEESPTNEEAADEADVDIDGKVSGDHGEEQSESGAVSDSESGSSSGSIPREHRHGAHDYSMSSLLNGPDYDDEDDSDDDYSDDALESESDVSISDGESSSGSVSGSDAGSKSDSDSSSNSPTSQESRYSDRRSSQKNSSAQKHGRESESDASNPDLSDESSPASAADGHSPLRGTSSPKRVKVDEQSEGGELHDLFGS